MLHYKAEDRLEKRFISVVTSINPDSSSSIHRLLNGGLLRDVQTVEELPDILVLDGGRLLDEGSRLADGLNRVTLELQDITQVEPHEQQQKRTVPGQSARPSGSWSSQRSLRSAS